MKNITLIMLSTFIIGGMLLNFENNDSLVYAQESVDRNIIPLLTPPYQVIQDLGSSDLNKFNVTFINNIP